MKIATWNVASIRVRLAQVLRFLEEEAIDVLALQEIKCTDDTFPFEPIQTAGYHVVIHGQKSYNGVALISRTPALSVGRNIPNYPDDQARLIHAHIKGLHIIGVYVPNGETTESPKYQYKLAWLAALQQWLMSIPLERVVLMGDMNIAPEDRDVFDPERYRDQVLCSASERKSFDDWQSLPLIDSFRLFSNESEYSWWDYRLKGFERNRGFRIDHIMISQDLVPLCEASSIFKTARAWERPSDHAPVILTLTL